MYNICFGKGSPEAIHHSVKGRLSGSESMKESLPAPVYVDGFSFTNTIDD